MYLILTLFYSEWEFPIQENFDNRHFQKPFQIHIEVQDYINPINFEYEIEEEINEEIPTLKIFREYNCVVCLNNKPGVLFYDCSHVCVCCECEKENPFRTCPYCRKKIVSKIIL